MPTIRYLAKTKNKEIDEWAARLVRQLDFTLQGSATWNPGNIADGDKESKNVIVTGAVMNDYAIASFSLDVEDLELNAQVTAADTATCVLANNTGGAIDLASGTVRVLVFRREFM